MASSTLAEEATRRPPILDDPFLWLEEIEGKRALEWVEQRNGETLAELQADKRYEPFLARAESLLNATDRIPYGSIRGRHIYNFWRDAEHVRGILRRTTLESYRKAKPEWETVLDVDALAKAENENWVYKSIAWLAPGYELCLVKLSRGGTDASVHREFDTLTKRFVERGFVLPEAKSGVAWLDRDTLFVGTNWSEGSLTESGYPRIAKRWKRGTPLAKAETIFEGREEDIGIWPRVLDSGETTLPMIDQSLTFYTGAYHFIGDDGKLQRLPVPESADLAGFYAGRILFTLRDAWEVAGETFPQGALLAIDAAVFQATGELPRVEMIYTPDDRTSIEGVTVSRSGLYVSLLQNVKGRILRFGVDTKSGKWNAEPLPLPDNGTVSLSAANPHSKTVLVNYEDHITPDQLSEYDDGANALTRLKSLPPRFRADGLQVSQHTVRSADGEAVPYFVIHRKGLKLDGSTPTILYGYGVCRGEYPWRRRVRAALAQVRAQNESPARVQRFHRRGGGLGQTRHRVAQALGHLRRQQRRPVGRCDFHAAPRPDERRRLPRAVAGHVALLQATRRCELGGRVRRSRELNHARGDPQIFAVSKYFPRAQIPESVHRNLDQGRPRAPRSRTKDGRPNARSGASSFVF